MARTFTLDSPLKGELLFARLAGTEALGALFEYRLTALASRADVRPDELLGRRVTVTMALGDGRERRFDGHVVAMQRSVDAFQGRSVYELTLRPWLWFLTRTSDCRIFQDMTVPEILAKVFDDEPAQVVEWRLSGTYRAWTYCVQYRETDFNFVSRLMEQEGIYYYFEHGPQGHRMVVCDGPGAHEPVEGSATFDYLPHPDPRVDRDAVHAVSDVVRVEPGRYALSDFDFKAPGRALAATRKPAFPLDHPKADYELYDYPGEFDVAAEGEDYAAARIEEATARAETFAFSGRERDAATGRRFKLAGHPRRDFDLEYLIVETTFHAEESGYGSRDDDPGTTWSLSFSAIRHRQTFRPTRATPKPSVHGVQTAVVTGPAGDEIHTDKYGRVKVQFHWDRYGRRDERSSCWVRVAYPIAGKGWGWVSVPRIGHEVVVSFEEGDPDRPLVIGSVYNGENPAPWTLPANATQSGMLTRSSKGGGASNANAIRFEDRKGAEQLWIHAEKDQDIEVENDETHVVGRDRSKQVGHDETTGIGHDRRETVGNDETITIGRNRTIAVGVNHTESIGSAMSILIGGTLTETVAINYAETVGGAMELTVGGVLATTVGGALAETVAGARTGTVGGDSVENVGGDRTTSVGGGSTLTVGKDHRVTVSGDLGVQVGKQMRTEVTKEYMVQAKKVQISADDEINLKCGSAEIVLKKNGDITIKGKTINVKGSGDVILKGSKVQAN